MYIRVFMIVVFNNSYDITQVQVTAKDCIHVRVYQLSGSRQQNYVLYGKTLEDPIEIQ